MFIYLYIYFRHKPMEHVPIYAQSTHLKEREYKNTLTQLKLHTMNPGTGIFDNITFIRKILHSIR